VPAYSDVKGNEKAKAEAITPFIRPEPVCGIIKSTIIGLLKEKARKQSRVLEQHCGTKASQGPDFGLQELETLFEKMNPSPVTVCR
jgi:hypothetical protein